MLLIPAAICLFFAWLLLDAVSVGVRMPYHVYEEGMIRRGHKPSPPHEYDDMRYNFIPNIIRILVWSALSWTFVHYGLTVGG